MFDPITAKELEEGREKTYSGLDRDLYCDIGFFATWFGMAELRVTLLLAQFTGVRDIEAFDILCRGMDARVKTERLRLAIKRHALIGPELNLRLAYFNDEVIPLRNKLMHSSFSNAEGEGPRHYYLSGLANMPWNELNMGKPQTKLKPTVVHSLDLYGKGVWLSYFAHDLNPVTANDPRGKSIVEIASPKSKVPEAFRQKHQRKADRATPDKQHQTAPE
jgi:hypothetical protein